MKYTWKGRWRDGEIVIEAESLMALESALKELGPMGKSSTLLNEEESYPEIPPMLGCTDAVRTLMEKDWGKQHRSMSEIRKALETNQLYFSKGALSATLLTLANKGDIRRVKEEGQWKYFSK